ncbi:MAG TPA: tRNA pseudouridine(55) synthase TruB [Clostridia bacterium]|nr:tRNA pseudouridine(55) synthase TruB [Clostridia bacterium]
MNGIICIDKRAGLTSFAIVGRVRKLTGQRKIGHAGTLDPMATGVLPVFMGRATKEIDILPCQDKTYVATVKLGVTTDTGDTTGHVLTETAVAVEPERFEQAALSLRGKIRQIPPMYSALKVNGRRLYDLAREGREVERQPREVTIYDICVLGRKAGDEYTIQVSCSKGTYIRTLCEDIGSILGCGAAMSGLRRTVAAGFSIQECRTLEQLEDLSNEGKLESVILSPEYPFRMLPEVLVTDKQTVRFLNGGALSLERVRCAPTNGLCRIKTKNRELLGIAWVDIERSELKMKCLLSGGETDGGFPSES